MDWNVTGGSVAGCAGDQEYRSEMFVRAVGDAAPEFQRLQERHGDEGHEYE